MRTSYDHVQKASEQLSRAGQWLISEEAQETLFAKLRWNVPSTDKISTCVVTANRIFSGFAINGHPVRQAHELENVLGQGLINMSGIRYRIWKGPEFCVGDLLAHINGETIIRDSYDSLDEVVRCIEFGNQKTLAFKTYSLDPTRLCEIAAARYSVITSEKGELQNSQDS